MAARKTRFVRALQELAGVLVVLAVSAALGEVALRLVNLIRPSFIFHDDSYNRFRGRPGSMFHGLPLNELGFVDVAVDPDKGDRFRLVALGDSFAFGVVPYPDNYLTLLEQHLDRARPPVEVVNMGIPRLGPIEERALLLREGLRLDPDLVLVSFFIGNDFLDVLRSSHQRKTLAESSYVLTLLRFAITLGSQPDAGTAYGRKPFDDNRPTLGESKYLETLEGRGVIYRTGWRQWQEALDRTVAAVADIQHDCQRYGVPLTVVLIPDEVQVDPELQRWLIERSAAYRRDNTDFERPTRTLSERLADLDIDVLDLYPAFLEATADRRLYKPRDTHWNIAGNLLAARLIADHLLDRLPAGGDSG